MKVSDQRQLQFGVQPTRISPSRGSSGPSSVADGLSQSPRMLAQRAAVEALSDSPGVVAERQELRRLFGEAAQRQASSPPSPNRTGLPAGLKAGIESLSGLSLNHVKVHYNSSKPAQLNALAYAQGSDIHVAPGSEQHLPHEAWHVVQQAQGRVQPTMQTAGVAVNDDAGLEREADVMGARALVASQSRTQQSPAQRAPNTDHPLGWVIQLVNFPDNYSRSFQT